MNNLINHQGPNGQPNQTADLQQVSSQHNTRADTEGSSSDKRAIELRLSVIYYPTDSLNPNPRNPRRHDRSQIKQLSHSITTFGFNVPVLIDSRRNVIAGHGRIAAAKEAGLKEVPTIQIEHLSSAQIKAFTIADNRLTDLSEWDDQFLNEQLKELASLDLDFNLEVTGFSVPEIDIRIQTLEGSEGEADPADSNPTPAGPAVSQPNDLWFFGDRHRLLCASALEESAYATLMQGETAGAVFTDPPYNVKIAGNVSGLGAIQHREFPMGCGEMSRGDYTAFLTTATTLMARHSRDGSIHFICMDFRHLAEILEAGRLVFSKLLNLCVWVKHAGGMGSLYRSQHELILVFKNGSAPHRNNVQLGKYGRNRTNVWSYPGMNTFGRGGEEGYLLALHPTVKPVKLVVDALLDVTARGDIVLDPFAGSGTTIIAAERTGRRCFSLEIDPLYVDTIVRRWQAYSGELARLAATGQTFNEIAAAKEDNHAAW